MYEYTRHGDFVVIKLVDELNNQNSVNLKEWILSEFLNFGDNKILLDMTNLDSIDSHALGILISLYKRILLSGGELALLSPNSNIRRLFQITGMEKILRIYDTLSEALRSLQ